MKMPKLTILIALFALTITPLILSPVNVSAATTKKAKKSRTHRLKKRAKRSSSKKKTKKTKANTRRVTNARRTTRVRRTTTTRTSGAGHHVSGRTYRSSVHRHSAYCSHGSSRTTRVVHHQAQTRVVHHHHSTRVVRRRPRVVHHHARTTHVQHHTTVHHESSDQRIRKSDPIDVYITGGLGTSSLSIGEVSDLPLNAMSFNAGIGSKGKLFGGELAVNGGKFNFDNGEKLELIGVSLDLKLQPKFGMLEPFGFVGIGGYALNDTTLAETAGSVAFRVGGGLDVRINNIGIGAKYQWGIYEFENDQSYLGVDATNQSITGNLSIYF